LASSWSKMISPGSHVNMSMLIDQYLARNPQDNDTKCPVRSCKGALQSKSKSLLRKWSVLILSNYDLAK